LTRTESAQRTGELYKPSILNYCNKFGPGPIYSTPLSQAVLGQVRGLRWTGCSSCIYKKILHLQESGFLSENIICYSRIEFEASRRRGCTEAIRLSRSASADLDRGERTRAQPLGSSWSHSVTEELGASARSGAPRQAEYFRTGRVSGPWVEVRLSCGARRTDEGHSDFVRGRAAKE